MPLPNAAAGGGALKADMPEPVGLQRAPPQAEPLQRQALLQRPLDRRQAALFARKLPTPSRMAAVYGY
ncbi:MAG: hypothetical protein K6T86_16425 [Pirellulales bacterium]|nr:hypothetical protein [Pirellulales bacterium]